MLEELKRLRDKLENDPKIYGVSITSDFRDTKLEEKPIKVSEMDLKEQAIKFISFCEDSMREAIESLYKGDLSIDSVGISSYLGICCKEGTARKLTTEGTKFDQDLENKIRKNTSKEYVILSFKADEELCELSNEKMTLSELEKTCGGSIYKKEESGLNLSINDKTYLNYIKNESRHFNGIKTERCYVPFNIFLGKLKEYGYVVRLSNGEDLTNFNQYLDAFIESFKTNKTIKIQIIANLVDKKEDSKQKIIKKN